MIFKKDDLQNKLGLNEKETKLILNLQKELPILTEDGEGFCVDGRKLWKQFGVKKKFNDWIKDKLINLASIEDEDYKIIWMKEANPWEGNADLSSQKLVALGYTKEYILTIDTAKELSMIIGIGNKANEESKILGKMSRKYFILIEKALKNIIRWNTVRHPEREQYKIMCQELDKYLRRNFNKIPKYYDYSNEANALNLICLGAKAKDIRDYLKVQDINTREHLTIEYNTYLAEMQKLDTMYIRMNIPKEKRYDMIQQGFKALYPHASFIVADKQKEKCN